MKTRRYSVFVFLLSIALLVSFVPVGMQPAMAQDDQQHLLGTSAGEIIIVPFQNGTAGVQTTQSYAGTVIVVVSGVGQASGTQWSDAFYIYTDYSENPITPYHPTEFYNWTLWINGGPADYFVEPIPDYNDNHVYHFTIEAPGGLLTFAVGDTYTVDNTGAYTVEIIREPKPWWKGVVGALSSVAKKLGLTVDELIARIKGLGPAWEGLMVGWQIYRANELADNFGDPDYRARLIHEAYNNYGGQNTRFRGRVDDGVVVGCALVGCTAESWNELTSDEKRDEDVWLSVCASVGKGYCSGYLLPTFIKQWLE